MMTWGFPCTDISVSGKLKGFLDEDGNKTRSGMYYEGIRILREKKPALSIIENVKNLTSKRFENEFATVLSDLDDAGYNTYWKVLNSKHFGVPQNRERVYIISIRKDLDNGKFKFPEPIDLKKCLQDLLEDEVDEKYYLSDVAMSKLRITNPDYLDLMATKDNNLHQVGQLYGTEREPNPQAGRIYSGSGVSPTMDTCSGGNRMPKILVPQATKKGYIELEAGGVCDMSYPNSKPRRGRVQDGGYTSPTITATETGVCKIDYNEIDGLRGRKLTPLECYRLQDFPDEAYEAARNAGLSDTQLYKTAGNSITCGVLYYIYREIYKSMPYLFNDLKLSSFFSGIGAFEIALDRLYKDINSRNFHNPLED